MREEKGSRIEEAFKLFQRNERRGFKKCWVVLYHPAFSVKIHLPLLSGMADMRPLDSGLKKEKAIFARMLAKAGIKRKERTKVWT